MLGRVLGEDVELSVETAPGVWPIVADRTQIEQVLLNLAVNSRDAMPKGGRLTIATVNAELDEAFARLHGCTVPGSYVSLTIQDTGCGMSPEVLAHAFDPFFTTKPQGKGTGLGLSIVYGIVKQNGGCIIIDSRPNAGTAVTILWPRSSDHEEVTRSSSVSSSHDQRGTETILLVEDEPGIRSLMRKALARHGYRVLEANDVWDALAIAAAYDGPIDLLLSDVIMPGLSGPDLAQRIITRRPAIKVLHVSGFPNSLTVNGDLNRRRVSFLAKPFTPQALVLNVRKCLDT
jgi:CheY-like chemotaxis protein